MMTLADLMAAHGTDKLHAHHYDAEYARHFEPIRNRPIRLLEIGIGGYDEPGKGGESLRMWRDYFPHGKITGLDIENKSFLDGDRISTVRGSQANVDLLGMISYNEGPFDVVIDDGSHRQADILTSFGTLFPLLRPGGIYCIEDMGTSYMPAYGGHPEPLRPGRTTIRLLADLIDGLQADYWTGRSASALQGLVASVHVSRELAFIYRK